MVLRLTRVPGVDTCVLEDGVKMPWRLLEETSRRGIVVEEGTNKKWCDRIKLRTSAFKKNEREIKTKNGINAIQGKISKHVTQYYRDRTFVRV